MQAIERMPSLPRRAVPAVAIGETAASALSSPGVSGIVEAVVSRALYVACEPDNEGPMVWIVAPGGELHSRAIIADLGQHELRAGDLFDVQGTQLRLGRSTAVEFGTTARWSPTPLLAATLPPIPVARPRIAGALEHFAAMAAAEPTDGFGGAILIARNALLPGSPTSTPVPSRWLSLATPGIARIAQACVAQDITTIASEAEELLGLGPGLTPSGDDFVGGLIFAAATLHAAYPDACRWNEPLLTSIADRALDHVNPISHALLVDHANGMGTAAAHDVLHAVFAGDEIEARSAAHRLTTVGHTSGWDILAGMMTGMLLAWGNQ